MHLYHKAKITSDSFRLRTLSAWAGVMLLLLTLFLPSGLLWPLPLEAAPAHSEDFVPNSQAEALFRQEWNRVDGPLVAGQVSRSWLWGPGPFAAFEEEYREASPGSKRYVMYFDKARMELTNQSTSLKPTNGLLVTEMISGQFQLGDNTFVPAPNGPATINVVGDTGNWLTYARLKPYASLNADNRAPERTGQSVNQQLSETGGVQLFSERAGQQSFGYYEPELGHNIPQVFWDFLNQKGLVYYPQITLYAQGQPIRWLEEVGFPLSEPYWVKQKVGGIDKMVMVQAFQRRILTFTPDNPPSLQVEMGNTGRHYVQWRYGRSFGAGASLNWVAPPVTAEGLREVVRGPTGQGQKKIAITLDAGSTGVAFQKEIAALDKYKVKITFFLTGRWALENPEYARYIATDNMEIANHTYSHPDLTTLSDEEVRQEISKGEQAITLVTGQTPRPFFRFPYGARDNRVMKLLNEQGYRSIYWTIDSLDSVGLPKSPQFLISRITGFSDRELDGAIILMHLGNQTSGEALGPILDNLMGRGFKIVTISELVTSQVVGSN